MRPEETRFDQEVDYQSKLQSLKSIKSDELNCLVDSFLKNGGIINHIPPAQNLHYNPLYPEHEIALHMKTQIYGESRRGNGKKANS
jgi:hypothetical protein